MVIFKLVKTFPVRVCEWLLSGVMVTWGIVCWNLSEASWGVATMTGLARIADQHVWGAIIFALGVMRLVALFRNGGWRPSPYFRMAGAFLACFCWLQLSLGFLSADLASLGMAVYPWLFVADIYNVFRASADARISDERARVASAERGSQESAIPAVN